MGPRAGLSLLYSNFFVTLPTPNHSFAGQTIIVTGSNTGLGREAANHIVRLGASKVILAVRNNSKGNDAKHYIELETGRKDVVEVWELDLANYRSVRAFARRAEGLPRLDAILENAGISTHEFKWAEDNESSITINVVSTFLLALLLLPKLRASAAQFHTVPRISVVSSSVHNFVDLGQAKASPKIFDALNDKKGEAARMSTRYFDTKLLEILYGRALASALSDSTKPLIVLNMMNPGLCASDLFPDPSAAFKLQMKVMARSAEEGSRALVDAIGRGKESHGQYLSDCKIARVSDFVLSKKGAVTQSKVWEELNSKLVAIQPGILENI